MYKKPPKFCSELELVSRFSDILKNQFDKEKLAFISEFNSPNGTADLVIASLSPQWRDALQIGKVRPEWAFALFKLGNAESFTVGEFKMFSGVTIGHAKQVLEEFSALGFCVEIDKNVWKKTAPIYPVASEICAIEAKLSNWKRALYQASRYYDFATQSWVVMDERNIASALANISRFHHLNVGLAGVNTAGDIYIHFIPRNSKPRSEQRYWYANASIGLTLSNQLEASKGIDCLAPCFDMAISSMHV